MKIIKTIQYLSRIDCLYGYCTMNCCDTKICSFYCKANNNEIISIDKEWENILKETKDISISESFENDSNDSEIEISIKI